MKGRDSVPVAGVAVSLHVIGADSGFVARVDTTASEGRFSFSLPTPPPDEAGAPRVYLATTRYGGVLYTGPALHAPAESPTDYAILVFEPRVADSLLLEERRTFVSSLDGGLQVAEVLVLANGSDSTLVAPGEEAPGWRIPLPPGAEGVEAMPVSPESRDRAVPGPALQVAGPVPPGGRRAVVHYRVPAMSARIPVIRAGTRHEVLVPEAAEARVGGLAAAGTADVEGVTYLRYVGGDLEPGTWLEVTIPPPGSALRTFAWIALGVGLAAVLGALWAWRRRPA